MVVMVPTTLSLIMACTFGRVLLGCLDVPPGTITFLGLRVHFRAGGLPHVRADFRRRGPLGSRPSSASSNMADFDLAGFQAQQFVHRHVLENSARATSRQRRRHGSWRSSGTASPRGRRCRKRSPGSHAPWSSPASLRRPALRVLLAGVSSIMDGFCCSPEPVRRRNRVCSHGFVVQLVPAATSVFCASSSCNFDAGTSNYDSGTGQP